MIAGFRRPGGAAEHGEPAVTAVITDPAPGAADGHPVGRAIAREAAARFGGLPPVTRFAALPGAGVAGRAGDRDVTVGSRARPRTVPARSRRTGHGGHRGKAARSVRLSTVSQQVTGYSG